MRELRPPSLAAVPPGLLDIRESVPSWSAFASNAALLFRGHGGAVNFTLTVVPVRSKSFQADLSIAAQSFAHCIAIGLFGGFRDCTL